MRPAALLAVVLLTDGDDCSAADPSLFDPSNIDQLGPYDSYRCFAHGVACANEADPWALGLRTKCKPAGSLLHDVRQRYASFLRSLKPDGRLLFAAITGDPAPIRVALGPTSTPRLASSCSASNVIGEPAVRLGALVQSLTPDSRLLSVCGNSKGDLSFIGHAVKALQPRAGVCLQRALLGETGELLCRQGDTPTKGATCQSSCLDRASCTVVEVVDPGTNAAARLPIPRCPAARFEQLDSGCGQDCPCWRITSASTQCSVQSPYYLQVLRDSPAKPGSFVEVDCRVADPPWLDPALAKLPRCPSDSTANKAP